MDGGRVVDALPRRRVSPWIGRWAAESCDDASREARRPGGVNASSVEREQITGDRLDALYRAHAPAARRLAYLLTGDRWVADDIAQDAFVRMAGRFLDLRDAQSVQGYVRRTVVSLVIARRRRQAVADRHVRTQRNEPDHHHDPDPAERDAMFQSLERLSARQRAALVCRYYLDLTDAEIADALKCRPGTVKSLLSRGIAALREELVHDR